MRLVPLLVDLGLLILLFSFFVTGALPQLEMLVTGGRAPVSIASYTYLAVYLLLPVILYGRFTKNPLLIAGLFVAAYGILDIPILMSITSYNGKEVWQSFHAVLFSLFVISCVPSTPARVDRRIVMFLAIFAFVCCFGVSVAQFIAKAPLLPTSSVDGKFSVPSFLFFGSTRAFSLFQSALDAGIFYCVLGGVGTDFLFQSRRRFFGFLLVAASAFGCYATLTRLTLIGFVAVIASVCVFRLRVFPQALRFFLPLAWATLSAAIVLQAVVFAAGTGVENTLTNTSSLQSRLSEWALYSGKFLGSGWLNIVFGSAISPWREITDPNRPATSALYPIDNGVLDIALNCGLIGLAVVGALTFKAWEALLRKVQESTDSFVIAIAATFSVLPFFCFINGFLLPLYVLMALALIIEAEPVTTERSATN